MRKILILVALMALVGCSTVQKCPEAPVSPKCPDSYAEAWGACEDGADRLEDALKQCTWGREICEEGFVRSLRKGW